LISEKGSGLLILRFYYQNQDFSVGLYTHVLRNFRVFLGPVSIWCRFRDIDTYQTTRSAQKAGEDGLCSAVFSVIFQNIFCDFYQTNYLNIYRADLHKIAGLAELSP